MNSGIRQLEILDSEGGAPFPAVVQYPTDQASTGTMIGPYYFEATPDAVPAPGRFPTCVISHGGGGSHLLYRSIGTHLAISGYVVVSLEHPGDNRNDRSRSGTDRAALDRPRHASCAIDAVLADPVLGQVADGARACVVGHSMGGYTALALVGGRPWSRSGQPIPTRADARVRAAVLLAPATDWFMAPGALADVSVPLLVLAGERDHVTPPAAIRQALAGLLTRGTATLDVVPGAGHYSFLTPFPAQMRRPDFPPATDPDGFDRDGFHVELPRRVEAFLTEALVLR
ncbi:MAG: alpha/beta hydrolase family protein [Vicinamibacterales bacterium]